MAFNVVTTAHGLSPQPTECRSPTCSLTTVSVSNLALGKVEPTMPEKSGGADVDLWFKRYADTTVSKYHHFVRHVQFVRPKVPQSDVDLLRQDLFNHTNLEPRCLRGLNGYRLAWIAIFCFICQWARIEELFCTWCVWPNLTQTDSIWTMHEL